MRWLDRLMYHLPFCSLRVEFHQWQHVMSTRTLPKLTRFPSTLWFGVHVWVSKVGFAMWKMEVYGKRRVVSWAFSRFVTLTKSHWRVH